MHDTAHERPVKQPLDTVKKLTGCRMTDPEAGQMRDGMAE